MYSLWELSTDSVVTALIAICISALAIAWLFAGRRRPGKTSELEQRRLAGREAEVIAASAAPLADASALDPAFAEAADDFGDAPQDGAFPPPLLDAAEDQRGFESEGTAPSLDLPHPSQDLTQPPPSVRTSDEAKKEALKGASKDTPDDAGMKTAPTARSPEHASAMSIAAALVRHDKREVRPSAPPKAELPLESVGSGGDDLTAITGITPVMAKEMNDLGIRYYGQIVDWSPDHAAWIASRLSSPVTNAQRSAWVVEAQELIDQPAPAGRSHVGRAG